MLLLLAVLTTGGGIVLSVLTNSRRIGQLVLDGGVDAALALPTRPLPYLLVRRVDAVNLGDVVFGIGLFAVECHPTITRTAIYLAGSIVSAVVLTSFLVFSGSVTFFTNRGEAGDLGFHAMLLLGAYPVDIFGGATKMLLLTVVPAGLVAAVPARLVDDFHAGELLALAGAAVVFAVAASAVFHAGLRRYTSSSTWTRA